MLDLSTPVTSLRMVGPVYSAKLKKLGITTINDLLYHIPRRYIDYSLVSPIVKLQLGEQITVKGEITNAKNIYTRTKTTIQKFVLSDGTGEVDLIYYNQPYLTTVMKKGDVVMVAGIVEQNGFKTCFTGPQFEVVSPYKNSIHTGRLVPDYPLTEGISSKWLRSRIYSIFTKFNPDIQEFLPAELLNNFNLWGESQALHQIHFPSSLTNAQLARERLSVDELLELYLASIKRKEAWQSCKPAHKINVVKYSDNLYILMGSLPFELTGAQKIALEEIFSDLTGETPMNRLLLGDVGVGKTVVAALTAYIVAQNGLQSLLMAPTQLLAQQHFDTLKTILGKTNTTCSIITSGKKNPEATKASIIVGTHALLHSKYSQKNIALVVIDEQQRFGVAQRSQLRQKANSPHLLTMTATPIPRTIALTLYADLSLSVIDEMPKGRLPIKTWVVPPEKRERAYGWMQKLIKDKVNPQQAFIVCPIIEESDSLEQVRAATSEFERLQNTVFPSLRLGLIHGRLKKIEKDTVLDKFRSKKLDILVATPVVEVGIDIPAATIMVIEAAERFGLAQLHQLRGRVGRGEIQSYCLLFTQSTDQKVINRIKLLEKFQSGPKLAQMDLTLRGPGDIYGLRQHGLSDIKIAQLTDTRSLETAKKIARKLLDTDATLVSFPHLHKRLQAYTIKNIAPD